MAKYCTQCGAVLQENGKYCAECGFAVIREADACSATESVRLPQSGSEDSAATSAVKDVPEVVRAGDGAFTPRQVNLLLNVLIAVVVIGILWFGGKTLYAVTHSTPEALGGMAPVAAREYEKRWEQMSDADKGLAHEAKRAAASAPNGDRVRAVTVSREPEGVGLTVWTDRTFQETWELEPIADAIMASATEVDVLLFKGNDGSAILPAYER